MDLSGLSAVAPGFIRGQQAQNDIALGREQARQAQMQTQEMMDERAALAALGRAFAPQPDANTGGLNTPPASPPQGPPSPQPPPTPANGAPMGPPGTYMNPSAPQPPAGPVPAVARPSQAAAPTPPAPATAAPPAPRATPAPIPAGPAAPPTTPPTTPPVQALQGRLTTQQLAAQIISRNPGIQSRPDLLVRAMVKGQALLAPDQKADLAALQIEQKIQAANQKFELGQLTLQNKLDLLNQANAMKLQIEQLKQAGADRRLTEKTEAAMTMLLEKLTSQEKQTTEKVQGAQTRTETAVAGREKVAETQAGARVDAAQIGADAKRDTQGATQQRLANAAQISAINRQISEMLAGGKQLSDLKPEEKARYDGFVKQRDALAKKDQEIVDRLEKAGGGKQKPIKEIIKQSDAGRPEEVPPQDASTLPNGTTASKGDITYVVENGKWVKQ